MSLRGTLFRSNLDVSWDCFASARNDRKKRVAEFFCLFVILYIAFADGDFVKLAHQFSAVLGFGSKFKNDAVSGGDRAFGGHDI